MTCAIDAGRCPLCGKANQCARVEDPNAKECWCATQLIAPELLARVPAQAVGCACICRSCVEAARVLREDERGA